MEICDVVLILVVRQQLTEIDAVYIIVSMTILGISLLHMVNFQLSEILKMKDAFLWKLFLNCFILVKLTVDPPVS